MRDEICLIKWQYGTEETQFVKLAESIERRFADSIKGNCERRMIAKNTKKNEFMIIEKVRDLGARKQYGTEWVAANEALFAPDWHETTVITADRCVYPIGIFAAFTAAIDEGACEYVVVC
jgi:hypothetical protein